MIIMIFDNTHLSTEEQNRLIQEIEKTYQAATGRDFDFFRQAGILPIDITLFMVLYDFEKRDKQRTIDYFLNFKEFNHISNEIKQSCVCPLHKFLDFYDEIDITANGEIFLLQCAQLYMANYKNIYTAKGFRHPALPRNPIPDSSYLDLATGFNFVDFYPQLETNCIYYLTDISRLTCKCLEVEARKFPGSSISVLQKNIMQLERTDISGKIGLIRAKNIFCYVPEFSQKLEEMTSWIEPGGHFIFQEEAKSQTISREFYFDYIQLFVDCGWKYRLEQGDSSNPLALDTLCFIKSMGTRT